MSDYNGWANRETWLVNIWFMDSLDGEERTDAEYLEEMVEEHIQMVLGEGGSSGFITDLLDLSEINWVELADNHNSGLEAEQ